MKEIVMAAEVRLQKGVVIVRRSFMCKMYFARGDCYCKVQLYVQEGFLQEGAAIAKLTCECKKELGHGIKVLKNERITQFVFEKRRCRF